MLTQHIALVPEAAGGISTSELARVSAALQKQVTRDFAPAWNVVATVDAFPALEDVPVGYWPIIVAKDLSRREPGVRRDERGQPYALIGAMGTWSLVASRACLEMLVNPFGDRTLTVPSPRSDQGFVELLLEVCAPCADLVYGYLVNDVVVADFCTPAYFAFGSHARRESCSHRGALSAPLQLREGGHLTWYDPSSHTWWMRSFWADNPIDTQLQAFESGAAGTARERAHTWQASRSAAGSLERRAFEAQARVARQRAELAAQSRALRLRALLSGDGAERPMRDGLPSDTSDAELVLRRHGSQPEAPRLSAFAAAYPQARNGVAFAPKSYDDDDPWGEAQVLTTEVVLADEDRAQLELTRDVPPIETAHDARAARAASEPPPLPHEPRKRADAQTEREHAAELSAAAAVAEPRSEAALGTSAPEPSMSIDTGLSQDANERPPHTSSIAPVAVPASVHPALRTRGASAWRMGVIALAVLLGATWMWQWADGTTHAASAPQAFGNGRSEITRSAKTDAPRNTLASPPAPSQPTSVPQAPLDASLVGAHEADAATTSPAGESDGVSARSRTGAAPSSSEHERKRLRAHGERATAPEPAAKVTHSAPAANRSTATAAVQVNQPGGASIDSLIDTRE